MLNTIVGAGAVGAGAVLRYGSGSVSGSDQKMRLRLRSTAYKYEKFMLFVTFYARRRLGLLQNVAPPNGCVTLALPEYTGNILLGQKSVR
jgi:hypothetical protein